MPGNQVRHSTHAAEPELPPLPALAADDHRSCPQRRPAHAPRPRPHTRSHWLGVVRVKREEAVLGVREARKRRYFL